MRIERPWVLLASLVLASLVLAFAASRQSAAQEAPTGAHYAGRASDTGHMGMTEGGRFSASIRLDLPAARGELPVPVQVTTSGRGFGAAGIGWDVPLSYVLVDRSFLRRRPLPYPDTAPTQRQRIMVSLPGRQAEMVLSPDGDKWIGRNEPDLVLREDGSGWKVFDGNGWTYTFFDDPLLFGSGMYLLRSIEGAAGAKVQLQYAIAAVELPSGHARSIDLLSVQYNPHPTTDGCFKHEVSLLYAVPLETTPQSFTVIGDNTLVRAHRLAAIDVTSRGSCNTSPERLRRYHFYYYTGRDTKQDLLSSVTMSGRSGTPEYNTELPITTYTYGTATTQIVGSDVLAYASSLTQSVYLPAGIGTTGLANTEQLPSSTFQPPYQFASTSAASLQSFTDITGDGRPDLVYQQNGKLWVARNVPGVGGKSTLAAPAQLNDTTFTRPFLDARSSTAGRYSTRENLDYVWTQTIDVNGDGRVDIVDAAAKPHYWIVYLNTPDAGPSGVKWVRRAYRIDRLYNLLRARGHYLEDGYLPLSNRATKIDHSRLECYRWDGTRYVPDHANLGVRCPLSDNDNDGDVASADEAPFAYRAEHTYVAWELKDINGDGYPDVVFNSSPVGTLATTELLPDTRITDYLTRTVNYTTTRVGPTPSWGVEVVLNVLGVFIYDDTSGMAADPFSAPNLLIANTPCGVGMWVGPDQLLFEPGQVPDVQHAECDIADVNGDGLADRVVGTDVTIGTGTGFGTAHMTLPGSVGQQSSDRLQTCKTTPPPPATTPFAARQTRALRDITGDGIPDYIKKKDAGGSEVYVGTGAGFGRPISVDGGFEISRVEETCDGTTSRTKSGLYDVDGDGMAERLLLAPCYAGEPNCTQWKLDVFPLVNGSAPGRPEAGRIIQIENGYGARTNIGYRSAKQDALTRHQVPFPEIVVDSIETTGTRSQGGTLTKTSYAYGSIEMFYDSIADGFRTTGYLRRIELRNTGNENLSSRQVTAKISDAYGLEPFTPLLPVNARFGRYLRVGRSKAVTIVAGDLNANPWALLTIDVDNDPRRIGATLDTTSLFETGMFTDATPASVGCMDMMYPYDYQASWNENAGAYNLCTTRGFLVSNVTATWRGSAAPPSSNNVQTRSLVVAFDEYGRTTSVLHQNDVWRTDDDVCVDVTYATPTGSGRRVLTAVASRKLWGGIGCGNGEGNQQIYSEESFEHDKLPYPLVSDGFITSHTVYNHATDTGQWLATIRDYDIDYNVTGNPIRTTRRRAEDGATRIASVTYDPFGLIAVDSQMSGTNVPTLQSYGSYDQVSLARTALEDPNGSIRARTYDGFGRPLLDYVDANGMAGVLVSRTYHGFDGTLLPERRVVIKRFADPVDSGTEGSAEGTTLTTFLDEVGRARYTHVTLGDDYANEIMVVGARKYDALGRVVFAADPYPLSANALTAYGTSKYYNLDGSLWVSIRGAGRQPFAIAPDASLERFPTVFQHSFANYTETSWVTGPDALTTGSPQYGVSRRQDSTAIGRIVSSSTWQNGTRIEQLELAYDRLGQQTKLTRYQDPSVVALPVEWSWQRDSLDQVRKMTEPSSTPQERSFSSFGELTQVKWVPPAPEPSHAIVKTYDAYGRLTQSVEQNDGVNDLDTSFVYGYDVPSPAPLLTPIGVLGRLSIVKGPTGSMALSYDGLGRIDARIHYDASGNYYERHGLHADGTQAWTELKLPDSNYAAERVDYAYDSAGRLQSMWSTDGTDTQQLYNAVTHDAWGRVRLAHFGQTAQYEASYATTGRRLPTAVSLTGGDVAGWGRSIHFKGFDAVKRELSRKEVFYDPANGTTRDDDVTGAYDRLGRLQTTQRVRTRSTLGLSSFSYDPIGNIQFHRDHVGATDAWLSYLTTDRDRICRIGYGDGGLGGTACNVEYDSFGNIAYEPTRTGFHALRYFNSSAVRSITNAAGATAAFGYDPLGNVRELEITASGTTQRSERRFGDFIVKRTQRGPGGTTTYTSRQFPGPEVMISRRGQQGQWIYQFSESRGVRVTIDHQGNVVQGLDYAPFGEATSSGALPGTAEYSNEQWNDGDLLAPFGLVHLGARVYDPVIGRFLSRDPLIIARSAATTNPYAFGFNDPMNFADPTGLDGEGDEEICIGICFSPSLGALLGLGDDLFDDEAEPPQDDQLVVDVATAWLAWGMLYKQAVANAVASVPVDIEPEYVPSETNWGVELLEGVGGGVVDMGSGFIDMVTNPKQTIQGGIYAVTHPLETVEAAVDGAIDTGKALLSGDLKTTAGALTKIAGTWATGKMFAAGLTVPRRVASRINLKKSGWQHLVDRHYLGTGSRFTLSETQLRDILQSSEVVGTPITRSVFSEKHGELFIREIDLRRKVGWDKYTRANTTILSVMTDEYGNLASAFPGVLK